MPELPEVETIKNGLNPVIVNQTIREVQLNRHDLRFPFPSGFIDIVAGEHIMHLTRRSKYLLIHLKNKQIIIIHLGMSGKLLYHEDEPEEFQKHDHVVFYFDDDSVLVFNDARRFGIMDLTSESNLETHKLFAHLGPEPLTDSFDGTTLYEAIKNRTSNIKQSIMNAENVVGVGNIYASESLFRSNISPTRKSNSLTKKECNLLAENIKKVLAAAIASGGSTLRDYVRSSGDLGYFQHKFQVYGRENEPCLSCDTPITRIVQSNRSTFYCKKCQR